MFTRTRQRLSDFRKGASPIASLADFGLWTLRNALPPWRPKFWLVLGVFAALIVGAALLPAFRWAFVTAIALAGTALLTSLLLSYFRTMLQVQNISVNDAKQHLHGQVSRARSEMAAHRQRDQQALNQRLKALETSVGASDAVRARVLVDLYSSDFIVALATEHDDMRKRVETLERALAKATEAGQTAPTRR